MGSQEHLAHCKCSINVNYQGTWVAQLVEPPTHGFGSDCDLEVGVPSAETGSALSVEPPCPSPCAPAPPPPCVCSHSLSRINKIIKC